MDETKTILIIEDEPSLLRALSEKLDREGFHVIEARNGRDGLVISLEKHPDLILLDIVMPVMDGMTMLEKLREDAWGKTAKVMILTNLTDEVRVAEAIEQGTYDYLVKSDWKIDDVVQGVKKHLG